MDHPAVLEQPIPQPELPSPAAGLRVLFLVDGMEAITAGGTERQLLQLVALARRCGAAPQICILRETRWLTAELAGCPVRHYDIEHVKSLRGVQQIADLVRWMRSQRFHLLLPILADASLIGPILGKLAGIPVVVGVRRNLDLFNRPLSVPEKLLLRLSNRLLNEVQVNSQAVAAHVQRFERIPARKLVTVYNGIDLDAMRAPRSLGEPIRHQLNLAENQLLIGNLSGLRAVKRLDVFLEAAAIILRNRPSLRFVVVGEGDQRPVVEQQIHALGLADAVTLAGAQLDVRPWLAAMDIAVLCSDAEGFSNSILECMAAGLPIVATDVGGNREALADAGILIPPGDPHALAEALWRTASPRERLQRGAAALRAVQRFDLRRAEAQISALYAKYAAWARGSSSQFGSGSNPAPYAPIDSTAGSPLPGGNDPDGHARRSSPPEQCA